ncbi:MAG: hydrogenase maturation nickel metallochaperone HypA [Flavobacteriaceae bacterium]|nr:hydrogenase maturation nickel metallochaperone HypA [Flavobacteriaceae bacterium]
MKIHHIIDNSNFINMHELSIALGIVKIAEAETKKVNAVRVESIELEIGTLAGIEFEALDFVWEVAVRGTVLETAHKQINIIQAKAKCFDCDTIFHIDKYYDSCPNCASVLKSVLQGKELRVKSLEVE